jgi:RimJ/RimL family protein N-acetyltransferase
MKYKCLHQQEFHSKEYAIVPIRYEDRFKIMNWRNEQIYHLRQSKPLTEQDQEFYFTNIVAALEHQEQPSQILFSYLKNGVCIGYGGLVHMNWIDKNAEISFIIQTDLEKDFFEFHWRTYLSLIEQVAFQVLHFHKIYTYAFDVRPHLYPILEASAYIQEVSLREHCFFNGAFINVRIHSKIATKLSFRKLLQSDEAKIFELANDEEARANSFFPHQITEMEHHAWFHVKLNHPQLWYYMVEQNAQTVAFVRIDQADDFATIGINIHKNFRGKGLGTQILSQICEQFHTFHKSDIYAYIKPSNVASVKSFVKAGFVFEKSDSINSYEANLYILRK